MGGYSDIFIHTLAKVIFLGSKFYYFWGLKKNKMNTFWGMKILWIFLGGHHTIGLYLCVISVHFRVFS